MVRAEHHLIEKHTRIRILSPEEISKLLSPAPMFRKHQKRSLEQLNA